MGSSCCGTRDGKIGESATNEGSPIIISKDGPNSLFSQDNPQRGASDEPLREY